MPKLIVSPAQALLLLMDKHEKNPEMFTKLKKWYLSGVEPAQHAEFKELCSTLSSGRFEYEVSPSRDVINEDPTRRYFETHLAHRTVQHGIDSIDAKKLSDHVGRLNKQLDGVRNSGESNLKEYDRALLGEFLESDSELIKEYGNYIERIDSGELFSEIKPEARDKVKLMAQASLLGVANAIFNGNLPLDIYDTGMYSPENKGKVMKIGQESTRNQHMGLIKGHMAVPRDSLAYSDKEAPLMKPSDQATYQDGAAWVEHNFEKLVHPYSNSISGTMLCQLRNLAFFKGTDADNFTRSPDEFIDFSKVFIGTMLYGSGGHTLHEFSAPLEVPLIAETFKDVSNDKPVTMDRLFMDGNEPAFDKALEETRRYNHQILGRALVHDELRQAAKKSALSLSKAINADLAALKDDHKARIDQQAFSLFRFTGHAKSQMISKACVNAMRAIDDNDPVKAVEILSELKTDFEKKFGKTVAFGRPSKSYEMIEKLEQKIQAMHDEKFEKVDEIKPSSISPLKR
ncbi:hypothetical protein [Legionella yabuuchiae]|uniref:hypothetical protein n=1 Tax=Legionella yabuuchiae TaxID=376727 RepID=UPI00105505BC|nr:hypothetical protein [Legionella yabuuchiae]